MWKALGILVVILGTPVGFLVWLFWHTRRQAQLRAQHAAEFRMHLQESIAADPEEVLDIAAIALEWGFEPEVAAFEAASLYRETLRDALEDGVVTPAEQHTLDALAFALQIDDETRDWFLDAEKQSRDRQLREERERTLDLEALHARKAQEEVEHEVRRALSEARRREKAEQRAAIDAQRRAEAEAALALADQRSAALLTVWPIGAGGLPTWSLRDIWRLDVVGESNYQRELLQFVGGRKREDAANKLLQAELEPEATNKHDRNAVRVLIRGKCVGYLAAEDAVRWKRAQAEGRIPEGAVRLAALITGGWKNRESEGHFGVKLDFSFSRNETAMKRASGQPKHKSKGKTMSAQAPPC